MWRLCEILNRRFPLACRKFEYFGLNLTLLVDACLCYVVCLRSGPAIALVLAKPAAIRSWRRLIGPTDPEVARATKPNCLRARFGEGKLPANACHGSDESPGSVAREVRFFFPNLTVEPVPDASAVKAALMNKPEAAGALVLNNLCFVLQSFSSPSPFFSTLASLHLQLMFRGHF